MGNFNNDRNLDVVVTFYSIPKLVILFGDGNESFERIIDDISLTGTPSEEILAADVNQDQTDDLVFLSSDDSYFHVITVKLWKWIIH